jgi:hypothetical protein
MPKVRRDLQGEASFARKAYFDVTYSTVRNEARYREYRR